MITNEPLIGVIRESLDTLKNLCPRKSLRLKQSVEAALADLGEKVLNDEVHFDEKLLLPVIFASLELSNTSIIIACLNLITKLYTSGLYKDASVFNMNHLDSYGTQSALPARFVTVTQEPRCLSEQILEETVQKFVTSEETCRTALVYTLLAIISNSTDISAKHLTVALRVYIHIIRYSKTVATRRIASSALFCLVKYQYTLAVKAKRNNSDDLAERIHTLSSLTKNLCFLAVNTIEEETRQDVIFSIQSKAIQSLCIILQNESEDIFESEEFLAQLPSLLNVFAKSIISTDATICYWNVVLFEHISRHFSYFLRDKLKIMYSDIVLRALESPATHNYARYCIIMGLFRLFNSIRPPQPTNIFSPENNNLYHLPESGQHYIDLFLNYDIFGQKVVEEIMMSVSKVAFTYLDPLQIRYDDLDNVLSNPKKFEDKSPGHAALNLLSSIATTISTFSNDSTHKLDAVAVSDKFAQTKAYRHALKIFNDESPKKGLEEFIKAGLVSDAESIADFFLEPTNLQKGGLSTKSIGEILGRYEDFYIEVLNAFTDKAAIKQSWDSLTPLQALRTYLGSFWCPSEGQQIERILEVFSDSYVKVCKEEFTSDTIFTLTMSVMLLNQTVHNPNVTEDISLDAYKEMCYSCDIDKQLNDELIADTYNSILKQSLPVPTQYGQEAPNAAKINETKLLIGDLVTASQELSESASPGIHAHHQWNTLPPSRDLTAPLLETWMPGVLSIIQSINKIVISNQLADEFYQLFSTTIDLCQYNSFLLPKIVEALADATNLRTRKKATYMSNRCLKLIVTLPVNDKVNSLLSSSYGLIFSSISLVEKHFSDGLVFEGISSENLEDVFYKSVDVADHAIVPFVKAFAEVSTSELKSGRTFFLEGLVNVTALNISRSKFILTQIWEIVGEHLTFIAVNYEGDLALYAINNVKQLAQMFLEKQDIADYNFQQLFLKPFRICATSPAPVIRELVLYCIETLASASHSNIQSGWKTLYQAIGNACTIHDEKQASIVSQALTLLRKLSNLYLNYIIVNDAVSAFIEAVSCCRANMLSDTKSEEAVDFIESVIPKIVVNDGVISDDLLVPCFTALLNCLLDSRLVIRNSALKSFESVCKAISESMATENWIFLISGTILPFIDDLSHPDVEISFMNEELPNLVLTTAKITLEAGEVAAPAFIEKLLPSLSKLIIKANVTQSRKISEQLAELATSTEISEEISSAVSDTVVDILETVVGSPESAARTTFTLQLTKALLASHTIHFTEEARDNLLSALKQSYRTLSALNVDTPHHFILLEFRALTYYISSIPEPDEQLLVELLESIPKRVSQINELAPAIQFTCNVLCSAKHSLEANRPLYDAIIDIIPLDIAPETRSHLCSLLKSFI